MRQKIKILLLVTFFVAVHCNKGDASLSNSLKNMRNLVGVEQSLIQNLAKYTSELYEKWQLLNTTLANMLAETHKARANAKQYLTNPINAFGLIRRMHQDVPHWLSYVERPIGEALKSQLQKLNSSLPADAEFREAVINIMISQTTLKLQPIDIVNGLINGVQYNSRLTADDCYKIGTALYDRRQYRLAAHWLKIALYLHDNSPTNEIVNDTRIDILDLYAQALLLQGNSEEALKLWDQALSIDPENWNILQKRMHFAITLVSDDAA